MERGKRQGLSSFFGGTGFYIALLLCVLAVGVGGVYWLFGGNSADEEEPPRLTQVDGGEEEPPVAVSGQEESQQVQKPVTVIMPEADTAEETGETPVSQPVEELPAARIVVPVAGETVTVFSPDALQYNETTDDWRTHDGVDIRAAAGTAVVAASAGTVLSVGQDDRLGVTVVIGHADGYETTYAGLLEQTVVEEGDVVSAGDPIGSVGNTTLTESALGAHLHFSVTQDGEAVDPAAYLSGE